MVLSPEQVAELKKQLSEQIRDLPVEQRAAAQKQIDEMSSEAIELMLKQQQAEGPKQGVPGDIFRMIIEGKIPSKMVAENSQAIAVLSTRAVSYGHTLIIPKKPAKNQTDVPNLAFTLAKKVAKKISSKLLSSSCDIQPQGILGEVIINVIPVYDKPVNMDSATKSMSEEELTELLSKLKPAKRARPIKKNNTPTNQKPIRLKRRIP